MTKVPLYSVHTPYLAAEEKCNEVRTDVEDEEQLVRFPNTLAPGSDIQIHVSWGYRLPELIKGKRNC